MNRRSFFAAVFGAPAATATMRKKPRYRSRFINCRFIDPLSSNYLAEHIKTMDEKYFTRRGRADADAEGAWDRHPDLIWDLPTELINNHERSRNSRPH